MNNIIPLLLAHIQVLNNQIKYLLYFIAKNIPLTSKPSDWNSPKYNKLKVDKLPLLKQPTKAIFPQEDYKKLLSEHLAKFGTSIRPINHKSNSKVPTDLHCHNCNAPQEYIYDNNGGKGQFLCKICNSTFHKLDNHSHSFGLFCPHCGKTLTLRKHRKNFNVYVCKNQSCSYFLYNLKALSDEDLTEFKSHPTRFKLHYTYREFTTDFFKIDLTSISANASSLTFRKFSPHIMGLCLTYLVNCGLSTRKTSDVLREVHNVKISHTQIANYATAAAFCVKAFVDNYDYQPSNFLSADETYTKVKGSRRYIWFIIDAIKKSILGYRTSAQRDVGPCILAMRMAFSKFKEFPRQSFKICC